MSPHQATELPSHGMLTKFMLANAPQLRSHLAACAMRTSLTATRRCPIQRVLENISLCLAFELTPHGMLTKFVANARTSRSLRYTCTRAWLQPRAIFNSATEGKRWELDQPVLQSTWGACSMSFSWKHMAETHDVVGNLSRVQTCLYAEYLKLVTILYGKIIQSKQMLSKIIPSKRYRKITPKTSQKTSKTVLQTF